MQLAAALRAPVPHVQDSVSVRPLLRDVARDTNSCTDCALRRLCMPADVREPEARALFARLVAGRVRLRKGQPLFRHGEPFTALFAVRVGSCKTVTPVADGTERVTGHHLPGDILGVDGIGDDAHACSAVALEDGEACRLPFDRIERLARDDASFQRLLHRLLSAAIVRERGAAMRAGSMRAEQRLASFLLDLGDRYRARGYSATQFVLRMTREEIGSHLALTTETVSRLFSRFADERLVRVDGRAIVLEDREGLARLVGAAEGVRA